MELLNTLGGLVVFIIILGTIIAVHEWGHFYFARRAGILAREFAFGMGPVLWKKKKGETLYSIRALPIGGFCAIAGEEVEDDPFKQFPRVKLEVRDGVIHGFYLNLNDEQLNFPEYDVMEYDIFDQENTGKLYMEVIKAGERFRFDVHPQAMVYTGKMEYQIAPYDRTIGSKPKRARAMVLFGGPLMNFLMALVVFMIAGMIRGFPVHESSQVVLDESTAAFNAGLRTGDTIINLRTIDNSINKEIKVWDDISVFMDSYTKSASTKKIVVKYIRDSQENETDFLPTITFNNLAISTVVHYNNDAPVGLKIIGYLEAKDELINNESLAKYITKGKDLIITGIVYDNKEILASNLSEVFAFFNQFEGNSTTKELNEIKLNLLHDGDKVVAKVKPYSKNIMDYQLKTNGINIIKVQLGISPTYKFNFGKSIVYSFTEFGRSSTAVFSTLRMLFNKTISIKSLSGFVGIGATTVKFVQQGLLPILTWAGLLSVNIGLMNLLPIPALDGGRLVFLGYEAITRKKPNQKVETMLIMITMLLLFGLMIFVTINDIIRII